MNSIERLPKMIEYKGLLYFLHLGITAWNQYNLCYMDITGDKKFSIVVKGYMELYNRPYDNVDGVVEAYDLDEAVELMEWWMDVHQDDIITDENEILKNE